MGVVGIRFRAVEFSVYHFVHDDFFGEGFYHGYILFC